MKAIDVLNEVSQRGRIFRVTFIKRTTGERRVMVCRRGVKKGVKGVGLAYVPSEKNLLGVYDMQARGFKMINLDTVLEVSGNGRIWEFTQ